MRTLWITRQDPRPADSGDLIYSLGLLRALADTGTTEITVLAHQGGAANEALPGVEWVFPGPVPPKSPLSLLSSFPSDAYRLGNRSMRDALQKLPSDRQFDRVVIDQAANAWALDELPDGIPLLYVSHNHEAIVRTEVAASNEGSLPFRLALRRDASNYARLECRLCNAAAGISAITPRDADAYRKEFPQKHYQVLSPGYDHPAPDAPPELTAETPRRVVLAGTFEWLAKRRNLEAFLRAASEPFQTAKIEFHVVGKADPDYFASLSARFPWATFEANVPSMEPYLKNVRIGLIPEALGGGFKLKALDYIFRGLPLASIEAALSGLPLTAESDCLAADSVDSLARRVTEKIDDLGFLNRAAKEALDECRDAFRWPDRGRELADLLHKLA
ncbi:hypothetical protein HAHE_27870 [Haloferula helveola]|uniref:Uncharacterized protein n=1 Tax=Haloferula helveola TaxID=490095 RepID=A0ABN6H8F8_9BACT|nr:hypothetical protein HAHE_27870 [Haloferula helveola]